MHERGSFGTDRSKVSLNGDPTQQFIKEAGVQLTLMRHAYQTATHPENVLKQASEVSVVPATQFKKHLRECPCCRAKALFAQQKTQAALQNDSDSDLYQARIDEALAIISVRNHMRFLKL